MRVLKAIGVKVLAVALAIGVLPAAVPANTPLVGISQAKADFYGNRQFRRNYYGGGYYGNRGFRNRGYDGGRGYYGRGYHRNRGFGGVAIGSAIIGLGLGAALASESRPRVIYRDAPAYYGGGSYRPYSRDWYEYCSARYRSFDPRSGTFQPYHGQRQLCR